MEDSWSAQEDGLGAESSFSSPLKITESKGKNFWNGGAGDGVSRLGRGLVGGTALPWGGSQLAACASNLGVLSTSAPSAWVRERQGVVESELRKWNEYK